MGTIFGKSKAAEKYYLRGLVFNFKNLEILS